MENNLDTSILLPYLQKHLDKEVRGYREFRDKFERGMIGWQEFKEKRERLGKIIGKRRLAYLDTLDKCCFLDEKENE